MDGFATSFSRSNSLRRVTGFASRSRQPCTDGHVALDGGCNCNGHRVALDFLERLLRIEKYDTVDLMMGEIDRDVSRAHAILGFEPVTP